MKRLLKRALASGLSRTMLAAVAVSLSCCPNGDSR